MRSRAGATTLPSRSAARRHRRASQGRDEPPDPHPTGARQRGPPGGRVDGDGAGTGRPGDGDDLTGPTSGVGPTIDVHQPGGHRSPGDTGIHRTPPPWVDARQRAVLEHGLRTACDRLRRASPSRSRRPSNRRRGSGRGPTRQPRLIRARPPSPPCTSGNTWAAPWSRTECRPHRLTRRRARACRWSISVSDARSMPRRRSRTRRLVAGRSPCGTTRSSRSSSWAIRRSTHSPTPARSRRGREHDLAIERLGQQTAALRRGVELEAQVGVPSNGTSAIVSWVPSSTTSSSVTAPAWVRSRPMATRRMPARSRTASWSLVAARRTRRAWPTGALLRW